MRESSGGARRLVKVIDQTKCIGCHACTTACKSENDVPVGVNRTYVKSVDVGVFPQVRRAFQVTRCNQCEDAPCVSACPTKAMYKRSDGVVDFDKRACIGCKACIAACPYDAIFINPQDHSAEKCNFCAHRLDIGLEPACVTVCPTEAIIIGDIHDPNSRVAQIVNRDPVTVRRPEKDTAPALFYKGNHSAVLDPLAARRPTGHLFAWSTGISSHGSVEGGSPGKVPSSAEAVLSYDVPHRMPWGWKVSAYTWTKGIASGIFPLAVALGFLGRLSWHGALLRWESPLLALGFLALTGGLLVSDLKHPKRFYFIFTRPQWKSWLVRGSLILSVYGALVVLYLAGSVVNSVPVEKFVGVMVFPAALATACYTAYLFAQAKARDLWQSPLLVPHLALQALLAGSAVLLVMIWWSPVEHIARSDVEILLGIAAGMQLLFLIGETTLVHVTAHSRLAVAEMTKGRFAKFFWLSVLLMLGAVFVHWLGISSALFALVALVSYEHTYVQAGQAVPLA